MKINLDTEEIHTLIYALHMWRNHIQTGNVNLSAKDIRKNDIKFSPPRIKVLSEDQMEVLGKLRGLIKKLEKGI